jgi:hypothetical protein
VILWLLACSQPEPPIKASLDLYAQGLESLEAGEASRAAGEFERARGLVPESGELLLWQAKALADSGDLAGSITLLDQAVKMHPGMVEAWYNRACYKARAGDLAGASVDLQQALRSPELDRLVVAQDPDLALLRADPANADWIPMPSLGLSLKVPTEPAFLGSEIELVIGVEQGAEEGLSLSTSEPMSPLLRPVTWIEERSGEQPGQRKLRLRLEVLGGGEALVGPFVVSARGVEEGLAPQAVSLLAPQSHSPPTVSWTGPFEAPSQLLRSELSAERLQADWVLVSFSPGDRVEWAATEVVRLELREDGVLQALGALGRLPAGETVSIHQGQKVVWEGSP